MKDGEWKRNVRFEYKWAKHRQDLFSPGATHSAGHAIDIIALKLGLETFEADAVDAYCKAPEHEEVVVGPATEYLERLARAGKDMHVVWRIRPQLRERRSAGQNWAEHLVVILVDKLMSCAVQRRATVLLYSTRHVALELHMDDIHGAASPSGRQQFIKAPSRQIDFKGGDGCEW